LDAFLPATTITISEKALRDSIADERKVCPDVAPLAGGQGSRALSVPMRDDSPAARITPQKLGAPVMNGR
jgi:hypothetical protein